MQNRGLLTEDDRRLFRGEKDIENEEKAKRERRHNVRQRIEHIVEDLELLDDAGEEELLQKFHSETDETGQLRDRVEALEEKLGGED